MGRNDRPQWARLDFDGVAVLSDLAAGRSLARVLDFHGPALHFFGAAAARSVPLAAGDFSGRVLEGASCNCSVLTLTPHANGTHTECVGHLTVERVDVQGLIPQRLLPAVLLTVEPELAADSRDSAEPPPRAADLLITRNGIERAWPAPPAARLTARAAVIRTLPNEPLKFLHGPGAPVPFLSLQAATLLVERDIQHLVLDLPSADRVEDGGALGAHRAFFGLPAGSHRLAQAHRPAVTITELAYIEDVIADGWYLLALQAPAIAGDAVPSRPVLYPLRAA
jgi:kynurenine formamidase